jgi:putative ABC transport system permease protein
MATWRNLRIAARSLRRTPGATLVIVLTLALGIGAATAMFSIVRGVLLRPLPFDQPERIVRLFGSDRGSITDSGTVAYLDVMDVRRAISDFDDVAAYDEWQPNLTGRGEAERLDAALVSASFFHVLGVHPEVGRFFSPEEDTDGKDSVVVLSYSLWQRMFGADRDVVGRTISLDGRPHTIIGVAPRTFEDPLLSGARWGRPALWRPLGYGGVAAERLPDRGSHSYTAIARLERGVGLRRANSDLATVMGRLAQTYPEVDPGEGMVAVPLREAMTGSVRRSLVLLLGAVFFAMLIVAANIGNLLLGRSLSRSQEFALRTALGATRRHILIQVMSEDLLLTALGAGLGLLLAMVIEGRVAALGASFIPRSDSVRFDLPVVGFAVLLSLAVGLACSIIPALRASGRVGVRQAVMEGGSRSGASGTAHRTRRRLVTVQVAIALMLVTGAGLLAKSYWNVRQVDPGLDPERVLSLNLAPSFADYRSKHELEAFFAETLSRLRELPGVRSAAMTNIIPMSGAFDGNPVRPMDRPPPPAGEEQSAQVRTVSPGYFQTMGIALVRGRVFGSEDRGDTRTVVVVNRRLADMFWPDRDPVGERLVVQGKATEIVGVVADVKHLRLDEPAPPRVYTAYAQGLAPWQTRNMNIVLRTAGTPSELVPTVRSTIRAIDPRVPIAKVQTMDQVIAATELPARFRAFLLGCFAALALALAAIGIYGVVSYSVTRRVHEIAIRMAIGAPGSRLLREVLVRSMRPVVLGLVIGGLGSLAVSRVLSSLLFHVSLVDPRIFAATIALTFALGLAATLLPARRAASIDPMRVLREE